MPLLEIDNLVTCISTPRGVARPVDGISLALGSGETHAIVGESGSGKTLAALSIMQLLPEPGGYIEGGRILFEGRDLLDLTWTEMGAHRGREVSMIFQEPMTSLNPSLTIGQQVVEAGTVHGKSRAEARSSARDLLERVGIEADHTMRQYPHELSGGMRQRVMIAMALMNRPKLLIADEPTTALDVTVQAQILRLLKSLQREFGMAVLLITHDLGVVAETADEVSVMYAGRIVEKASVQELFAHPRHPYTRDLLASLPTRGKRGEDLTTITGAMPDPVSWPRACRYSDRCRERMPVCTEQDPQPRRDGATQVSCHLYPEESP